MEAAEDTNAPLLQNPARARAVQIALRAALDDPDANHWEPPDEEEDPEEYQGVPPPPEPTSGDRRGGED